MEDEGEDLYRGTVYSNPGAYELEIVSEIDLDNEPYQFNMVVVWRGIKNGKLYIGRDSGCSCPSPFEGVTSLQELEEVGPHNIEQLQGTLREAGVSILDIIEMLEDARQKAEKTI